MYNLIHISEDAMQVTDIRNSGGIKYEPPIVKKEVVEKQAVNSLVDKNDINVPSTAWQKNILFSALDKLENIIHTDNSSHPLDKASSAPIETPDEARMELNFLKTAKFKNEAYGAQANIEAADVVGLFVDEAA